MTKAELLADIAKGRSVAERLPLYAAAMQLGLLKTDEIQSLISHSQSEPAIVASLNRTTKKAAAKKAPARKSPVVKEEEGVTP